jgi:hypothetical protein
MQRSLRVIAKTASVGRFFNFLLMGQYGNYPNPELCRKYGCHKKAGGLMSGCDNCLPQMPDDEALSVAREEARSQAVRDGGPVAIVVVGTAYALYNAFTAYENHLPVKEVVSHL